MTHPAGLDKITPDDIDTIRNQGWDVNEIMLKGQSLKPTVISIKKFIAGNRIAFMYERTGSYFRKLPDGSGIYSRLFKQVGQSLTGNCQ